MKLFFKNYGGYFLLLAVFGVFVSPFVGQFVLFYEQETKASNAIEILKRWTQQDCELAWKEAVELSEKYGDGKRIDSRELPEPLRIAGFKSAYVSASEFRARRGGSSFGSSGAIVLCFFEGNHGSAPYLAYPGGTYFPKTGRWSPH